MTYRIKATKDCNGDAPEFEIGYALVTDASKGYEGQVYGHARMTFYTRLIARENSGWTDPRWHELATLTWQCNSELVKYDNQRYQWHNQTRPGFEKGYKDNTLQPDDQHFWSHWYSGEVARFSALNGSGFNTISDQVRSAELFGRVWAKIEKVNEFRNFSKAYPDGLKWLLLSLDAIGAEPLYYDHAHHETVDRGMAYVTA